MGSRPAILDCASRPQEELYVVNSEAPVRVAQKAVKLLEYGGQLVFDDVPTPSIAGDEVLVRIKSTAVNHLDLAEASGTARQIFPLDRPWIPGHEFSGVVERIGGDVEAFAR